MNKVTYEIVILDTLTQRVTDNFSPMFTLLDTAKDWLKNERPLVAGCEFRIRKTTVELEMQRMAKRIEELEAMLERQTARIVDLQTHIENFDGEDR